MHTTPPGFESRRLHRGQRGVMTPIVAMEHRAVAVEVSSVTRFRRSLTVQDWRSLAGMTGFIIALHVVGFFGVVRVSGP
jgi:hypothetical protein